MWSADSKGWDSEQIEGAFGLQVFGYAQAECDGVSVVSVFGFDLDHGLSVRGDDLGDHLPLPFFVKAMGADGEGAAAAEGVEGGAFSFDGEAGIGMFEEGDGVADVGVACFVDDVRLASGFEREGSLAGCGTELARGEPLVDGFGTLEAIEAGGGEDEGVALALLEFAKASVDVAANFDEGDIGAEGEDLCATAWAGSADSASSGEGVERPVGLADPDVTGVGAFWDGCKGELRGQFGWEIFEGVDGQVDAAFFECFFNFFDEDTFAVEVWRGHEAWLLHAVAGGADDLEFDVVAGIAEGVEDVVGLPEGQLRASAADANWIAGVVVLRTHSLN
jgi:hypothetical protein